MIIPFVDLKAQYHTIRGDIDAAIADVLENTAFVRSHHVTDFENAFSQLLGVKHVIGVGNGTDAIFIALKMLGIGPGDEVITTATTWIATSETISMTGATPVFVDINPDSVTLDPTLLESALTERTRAIIPVHLYGHVAHMDAILDFANKHNLKVIEDCAQAHLSTDNGRIAGTMGNVGTFSFYPGKNLGAYGDAGAVVTDDDELAEKIRMFANHGQPRKNTHRMEGVNSRLDGIQAAILLAKLPYLKKWTEARRRIAEKYNEALADIEDLDLPSIRPGTEHSFHIYGVRTDRRNDLQAFLRESGIGVAVHYPTALPFMEAYSYMNLDLARFENARRHAERELSLPLFPEMGDEQIETVVNAIHHFFA